MVKVTLIGDFLIALADPLLPDEIQVLRYDVTTHPPGLSVADDLQ